MSSRFFCRRTSTVATSVLAAGLCLLLTGCIVVNKNGHNGKQQKSVSVVTPFGGIHVQSNQTTAADLGLTAYPGAVIDNHNDNDKSANVDMGFGPWHMKVKVVTYTTPAPRDKVIAYYRKALGQFGTVIACNDNSPVGKPTQTSQGLACSNSDKRININMNNNGININGNDLSSGFNLRAGSPHHQRIVAIQDHGANGTKFTLVELVLPHDNGKNNPPD